MRLPVLLAVVALALAPAAARAQFAPLPPAQGQTTPTVVVAPDEADGGLKTWQEVLIFGAGVILIGGIGWAIVSDARSRAPIKEGEHHRPGTATKPRRSKAERERARAKAKAARAQRKRSRR